MLSIIVNDRSGDGAEAEDRRAALGSALEAAGLQARILTPGRDEDIGAFSDRLLAEGTRTLVAAGGDGTIAAVAASCHAAGARLGVIPQGTFNYFARAHGIPLQIDRAVAVLKAGHVEPIRIAAVNESIFLNNASVGLYPAILDTREGVYARYGRSRLAAYWSVVKTLMGMPRPLRLTIEMNGTRHKATTPLAFVASSAYQLEEFGIDGAEAVREGYFALLLARPEPRWSLVRSAWRMARRDARRDMDFTLHITRDLVLHTDRRRPLVARDGETGRLDSPLYLRRLDAPLSLVVPGTRDAA